MTSTIALFIIAFCMLSLLGLEAYRVRGIKNTLDMLVIKYIEDHFEEDDPDALYVSPMDLRGTPTHLCVCGSQIWNVKVIFDNFEIGTYFLEMECINCHSVATAPTPLDREKME